MVFVYMKVERRMREVNVKGRTYANNTYDVIVFKFQKCVNRESCLTPASDPSTTNVHTLAGLGVAINIVHWR